MAILNIFFFIFAISQYIFAYLFSDPREDDHSPIRPLSQNVLGSLTLSHKICLGALHSPNILRVPAFCCLVKSGSERL